jgi:colanic acid/amylovoran biosynthesis glycosyltransferase
VCVSTDPTVAIFRSELGRREQSFIFRHAEGLTRYRPLLVASRYSPSYDAREHVSLPRVVLRDTGLLGPVRDVAFRLTSRSRVVGVELRRRGVDLVHAHFGPDAVRVLPVARSLGLPLVTTFHGFDATRSDEALRRGRLGERRYLDRRPELDRAGVLHLAVSAFIRGRLLELGFDEEKTVVHHLGVDTEWFSPGRPTEPGLVVFVGRLEEEKGCFDFLEAAAHVRRSFPRLRLAMIGDGTSRARIHELVRRGRLPCELPGMVGPEVVRDWMQRASIVCCPSKTSRVGAQEGFGLVCAEAQATGTPVVAYASGGVPEAVCHGVTGLLSPEGDTGQLARHIRTLLDDPTRARAMGVDGRRRVLRDFDERRQIRRLEDHYDRVLASRGRPERRAPFTPRGSR